MTDARAEAAVCTIQNMTTSAKFEDSERREGREAHLDAVVVG